MSSFRIRFLCMMWVLLKSGVSGTAVLTEAELLCGSQLFLSLCCWLQRVLASPLIGIM